MAVVAQLVRVGVCGALGRGFESHHPPVYFESPGLDAGTFFYFWS